MTIRVGCGLPSILPMRELAVSEQRTVHRVCPFCEATCGLSLDVDGETIVSVRGDAHDPFSHGFICPKAYGLKELHHDPERLRRPMRRSAGGWTEITWDEAYAEVASGLTGVRARHGKDAIGMSAAIRWSTIWHSCMRRCSRARSAAAMSST